MKRIGELAPPHDEWTLEALPTMVRRAGEETWHEILGVIGTAVLARCGTTIAPGYVSRDEHPGAIYGDVSESVGEPRCAECEAIP